MPIEFRIDAARRRVHAVVTGDVSLEEMLAVIDRAVHDPRFERGYNVYSDHTDIGQPITTPALQEVIAQIERVSDYLGGARWAIVTRKPASFGMMRMFSALAERVPLMVEVFETEEDAERWLSAGSADRGNA